MFELMKAVGDPDINRALGFGLQFLKEWEKNYAKPRLNKNEKPLSKDNGFLFIGLFQPLYK